MSFLPEGYKEPVNTPYMNFEDGTNTFRVLGSATLGWEYWTMKDVDGEQKPRPVRVDEEEKIPVGDVIENSYGNLSLYFFWAVPVYSFDNSKIQLLVIKQKTVRQPMQSYIRNPKWGDPKGYNFIVVKDVNEKPIYKVEVEPKEKLDPKILEKYESMTIDMDAWMKGEDPFAEGNL